MILVNGIPANTINAEDRGLAYGDGVFRTLRMRDGNPLCWERQYAKLQHDAQALNISCPQGPQLFSELQQLGRSRAEGVAKIIITRGVSARGYAPAASEPTRILSIAPLPDLPPEFAEYGIRAHLCQLRLGYQPRLAGIKHLNRLENVLAAGEWQGTEFAEGILLDLAGNVVSGTRSNLFMIRDGELLTPDLSRCGVAGVQRERVLDWAQTHGVACRIANFGMAELLQADEIFLVNSVFGLWPVRDLAGRCCDNHPISKQIQNWLNDETH